MTKRVNYENNNVFETEHLSDEVLETILNIVRNSESREPTVEFE